MVNIETKLLYLMHVPWGWIKQRPHFIAEYLNRYFDVDVYYLCHIKNLDFKKDKSDTNVNINRLWISPSRQINKYAGFIQLRDKIDKYKYIWITHPCMFNFVKKYIRQDQFVIYDCMDDAIEFPHLNNNKKLRERLMNEENELCERCDIILASSEYLRKKLVSRYNCQDKVDVVRNAVNMDDSLEPGNELPVNIINALKSKKLKLTYLGTISEWMDIELILESLDRFDEIEYLFFGIEGVKLPSHSRIKYFGPVTHNKIFKIMALSDALIMPFVVTELIKSVNPVKVYEYIFSGKPSIVKKYGETEQFVDYVHLYNTKEEYFELVARLLASTLTSKLGIEETKSFISRNTWKNRTEYIAGRLEAFQQSGR